MASNHRRSECMYDEAYVDEAYNKKIHRGKSESGSSIWICHSSLSLIANVESGLGLGSKAATLLSSVTEEWSRMKKKGIGERAVFLRWQKWISHSYQNAPPLSLSRKVCASSFSSVLITPQFRSVGPSLVAPAPALPWSSPTSHQVHLGWGEVRGVAALH